KRVLFPSRILVRMIDSVRAAYVSGDAEPTILTWPYGGIGGMCELIASTFMERYMALLERFNVSEWADAVERLKPTTVTGVPTVARMILDAKVPREKISSVKYFTGGSAPMTAELQEEFESTYGIQVIWAYGATEFCGTVISWTPALYEEFRKSKAGAMGKALPGIELRVTDVSTGEVLPAGQQGYLEALVPQVSDDWIHTTDLVVIDEDGFVFHHGRGDGAIVRGGHKVIPEKVIECLRAHPAVLDAAVVGLPDQRLGAVPAAMVELKADAGDVGEDALKEHVRAHLTSPQVPVKVLIVPAIPRTTSLKADLTAVRKLLDEAAQTA
ncbi:MAG: fatty acid--CoA ligase family protein, partial [Novosphingobium sp.]